MRLKRLEITGFKSFRDRVVFDFFPGITAIVGPNGCGKSNVVDALRWVMGEQQVRYIRGKRIEDVIFHGSEEAPAVGLAEVSLILSRREDQPFPEPYENFEEISISRRQFREGESEYYINKIPCRLLDIREFFMGTGVGARTYSMVEQNSIGQLVEAKPEDRRLFIEEAAGISKYKTRKDAAVKKIESTKQNLARLNDIIREVKGQLNSLSRQAKRAEEFKELKHNLKQGEINLAVHAYRLLKSEEEEKLILLEKLKRELLELETLLTHHEAQLGEIKGKITETEAQYQALQEILYQQRNDLRLKEQEIAHIQEQSRDVQTRTAQNRILVEELKAREKEIEEKQRELTSQIEGNIHSEEEKRAVIRDLEEELKQLRSEETQFAAQMEKIRSQYVTLASEKARVKNEENAIERILTSMERQKERDEKEMERHREILGRMSRELGETESAIARGEKALSALRQEIEEARGEEEELRKNLKSIEEEISSLKESLSGKSSRLSSLKEFHEGYAWCGGTAQAIMTSCRDTLPGLVALVADCLTVQAGYERAVESVLGEKLQYVIVKSMADGLEAISYLKEASLGRGHFVPLELRTKEEDLNGKSLPPEIDPLLKHVSARTDIAPIVNLLLRDTFVVPDIRQAVKFWSNNGFWGTLVTPEGDIVTPHGMLSGGGNGEGDRSLFQDKREMSELEEEINRLTTRLQEKITACDTASTLLQSCLERIKKATERCHQSELELNNRKKDREKLLGELKRVEQSLKTLEYNLKARATEEKDLKEKRQNLIREFDSLTEKEREISQRLESLQKKTGTVKLHREKIEGEITQCRISLASLEEKRQSLLNERKRLEEETGTLRARVEKLSREVESSEQKILNFESEGKRLKEAVVSLYATLKSTEENLSKKREEKEELNESLKRWEEFNRDTRKKMAEVDQNHRRAQEEWRDIQYRLSSLEEALKEKYAVSLSELIGEWPIYGPEEIASWEEKIKDTRAALDSFGEVNLLAIEEYNALKERYDFLTAQAGDLNQSILSLQRTIATINRISRERFAQTFSEVNASFQRLFSRIFPGGRGELVLVDKENLLETGIDIEIQMPGKRRQHVSLLSGGEKAMVALSFILAFVVHRPTPFIVLDEVDAALDDANINLFASLMKEIALSSQVIMITHNKISMEAAQYLYGITMEKKGISTVISVSLD